MKSKITVDLDHDNQPVLKIEYRASEDVRDKMVKRLIETLGYSSVWFRFYMQDSVPDGSNSQLRPIKPEEMNSNAQEMLNLSLPLTGNAQNNNDFKNSII